MQWEAERTATLTVAETRLHRWHLIRWQRQNDCMVEPAGQEQDDGPITAKLIRGMIPTSSMPHHGRHMGVIRAVRDGMAGLAADKHPIAPDKGIRLNVDSTGLGYSHERGGMGACVLTTRETARACCHNWRYRARDGKWA